jgi:hypothetical protein
MFIPCYHIVTLRDLFHREFTCTFADDRMCDQVAPKVSQATPFGVPLEATVQRQTTSRYRDLDAVRAPAALGSIAYGLPGLKKPAAPASLRVIESTGPALLSADDVADWDNWARMVSLRTRPVVNEAYERSTVIYKDLY